MRKTAMLMLLMFLVVPMTLFVLAGCGTSRQPETRRTEATTPAATAPQTAEAPAEDTVARDKRLKEGAIQLFRRAFAEEKEGEKTPEWAVELRGRGSASAICALQERFSEMSLSLVYLRIDRDTGVRLTPEDVGMSEADARKKYRQAGIVYAKEAARILGLPPNERAKLQGDNCGPREGGGITEGGFLMEEIERTLKAIGASPQDIGTTSQKLRSQLLADYVSRIAGIREMIRRGEASESDGGGYLHSVAEEATNQWGFTAAELRLTQQETAAKKE